MMKKISGSPLCNISNDNEALAASAASPTPGTCETSLDDKFLFNWVQKPECETISHVISHCGRGRGGGIIQGSCLEYSLLCEELLLGWQFGFGCGVE